MKQIEFRMADGRAIEMAVSGRIVPATLNLRALGCPEHIARAVEQDREKGAILRRADAAMRIGAETPKPELTLAEKKARAAQIGRQIAEDDRRFRGRS